jgi:hypothetical protein
MITAITKLSKQWLALAGALLIALPPSGEAAIKKPIEKVDPDAFTKDTQIELRGAGDNHAAMVWWIPVEFWQSVLSRDSQVGSAERQEVLRILEGTSLLAVVQADISPLGVFDYYGKEEVLEGMSLTYTNGDGKAVRLLPLDEAGKDIQMVLSMLRPVLEAAMGELGGNMHFYVLSDTDGGARKVDPFISGKISATVTKRDQGVVAGDIRLPLNSLFETRKCPNGEDADISWFYCPWTGKKLD